MGYYHIELSPGEKNFCIIVLPWGKHEYQKLCMGVYNSLNIFQKKISELFKGFKMVRPYIDEIILISKNEFKYHINSLEKFLQRISEVVFKVNAEKSFFGKTETEYLGFWVSNNGVRPQLSKLYSIKSIYVMNKL